MENPDFGSMIYAQPIEVDNAAIAMRDANAQAKYALLNDLTHQDFQGAAAILQGVGACRWGEVVPQSASFIASYSMENGKASLTISQPLDVGGWGLFKTSENQYVPRLTVTADSCHPK